MGQRSLLYILLAASAASCAQGISDTSTDSGTANTDGGALLPEADADIEIVDGAPADACVSIGPETCDGTDEDCDSEIDEDFDVGAPCDSDDADECLDDVIGCSDDGESICIDVGPVLIELCNGIDDDCVAATADGSGDGQVGVSCDGPDGDLCAEGTSTCVGGELSCSDSTGTTADICNGINDDCDDSSPDGSEDPNVGALCDGPDGDLCAEGLMECSGAQLVCGDQTTTTVDLCNGIDDDCDASSDDGSEDPLNGAACDGPDGDLCQEGTRSCQAGTLTCSDTTGTTIDTCNGLDDDCDQNSADGSEDPLVGVFCDGPDSDLCNEGTTACVNQAVTCSDTSTDSTETCNGLDDDCDTLIDEDFPRDTNPVCTGAQDAGSVSGDSASAPLSASEGDERWYRLTISENDFSSSSYLSARLELQSPPGADFDLHVYCESCGGALAGSSVSSSATDIVDIKRLDGASNESFEVLVEVRLYQTTVCADWTLTVTGDTYAATETCPL